MQPMLALRTAEISSLVLVALIRAPTSCLVLAAGAASPSASVSVVAEWTSSGTTVRLQWWGLDHTDRSSNITSYVITYYEFIQSTGAYGKETIVISNGNSTSHTLYSLRPWKSYLFKVQAKQATGLGLTSPGVYLLPAIQEPKGCEGKKIYLNETASDYQLLDANDEEEFELVSCSEGVRTKAVCTWLFTGLAMDFRLIRNESLCKKENQPDINPVLKAVNLTIFSEDTALASLGIIYNFTSAVSNITKTDLEFMADRLNVISQSMVQQKGEVGIVGVTTVSTIFAGVVDNIMNPDVALASSDADVLNATRRLTSSMEGILQSLMLVMENTSDSSSFLRSVEVDKQHVAYRVTQNSSIVGVYACDGGNASFKLYYLTNESSFSRACNAIASIILPKLDSAKAFISYSNSRLFDGAQLGFESARSQVVGSLLGRNAKLDEDVILQFDVSHVNLDRRRLGCAFWDYEISNWSFNGCNSTLKDNSIECRCNHLTHFAVLLDWRTTVVAAPREALTIISRVGLSVSTVGLGLVIVTFILFRSMRRTTSQRVLFNLSLSLAGLNLCFLVGFDLTDNHIVCTAMAATTHYFLLTSFTWMLVEGVLQYLRLVKVLNTYVPNFVWKASVPSWGVPAVAVVVLVVTDSQHYMGYDAAEALQQCWVSKSLLLYAVVVPIGAIVLANVIIFILIVCSLRRGSPLKLRSNRSEREISILHLKASVSILVLLGVSWIFGFLVFENDQVTLAFQYLFCIINSLQGLMIFVFHNVREPFVRKQWRRLCFPSANGRRDSTTLSSFLQSRRSTAVSTSSQRS